MDNSTLTATGTLGCVLLILYAIIKACRAEIGLGTMLGSLMLLILSVDLWAVLPAHLEAKASSGHRDWWLWWAVALVPYGVLIMRCYRFLRKGRRETKPPASS